MIVQDAREFKYKLKKGQRILGIDYGEKNIGIAISDTRQKIAVKACGGDGGHACPL